MSASPTCRLQLNDTAETNCFVRCIVFFSTGTAKYVTVLDVGAMSAVLCEHEAMSIYAADNANGDDDDDDTDSIIFCNRFTVDDTTDSYSRANIRYYCDSDDRIVDQFNNDESDIADHHHRHHRRNQFN